MDSTLYKKYKFSLSPEIEEKLRGDACFNFVKPILEHIYEVYPELLDGLSDDVQQICNLDPQLTLAAIHSAYISLASRKVSRFKGWPVSSQDGGGCYLLDKPVQANPIHKGYRKFGYMPIPEFDIRP